jgi:hypothetical protein
MFQTIKDMFPDAAFAIYTGDTVAHLTWETTTESVENARKNTTHSPFFSNQSDGLGTTIVSTEGNSGMIYLLNPPS